MSTVTPDKLKVLTTDSQRDLKICMHSPLLYWWPVWAVGFLMALWTYLDNYHLVLVPENAIVAGNQLLLPEGGVVEGPAGHMARSKLSESQKAKLSAHVLWHTSLRKVTAKQGVQFAMEAAGHASSKEIGRYVKPSEEEKEKAREDLF